ncbi:sulfotransferase [Sulfitobacter sabulilitoris]|uniref:sulfotransferase n=1 Tax=Sulfitobacter sabulilitoris TaxID=2562655 RepID=UPI0014791EEE|nr:sulfotransferase [Sulfitobacter sabulilitoris]
MIFVGRGGSGTRLVSKIAMDAGVFLGTDINPTNDSMEWRDPIYEIALEKMATGAPIDTRQAEDVESTLRDCARAILDRAGGQVGAHWGWKLPETMFILPEVLHAFPNARVVHLLRHPVTCCLRNRHVTSDPRHRVGAMVLKAAYHALNIAPGDYDCDEATLDNAVSWAYQVGAVARLTRDPDIAGRVLSVCYEDIFDDWSGFAFRLSGFIGVGQEQLIRPILDPARRRAFDDDDPRIAPVWSLCKDIAQGFGYALETGAKAPSHRSLFNA